MGPAVQLHKPIKVHTTTGAKPKAGDYEVTVQTILAEAIPFYHGYLSTETPYPGPMEEMRWAKKSWKDSCEECDMQMAFNSEIIKLVSDMSYGCTLYSPFPKITSHSSHFHGRIKTEDMLLDNINTSYTNNPFTQKLTDLAPGMPNV